MNTRKYWEQIKNKKQTNKLIYVHIPKTGGSYVGSILKHLKIKNLGHQQARKSKEINFTVFRDPVSRFESMLNFRLTQKNIHSDWPEHLTDAYTNPKLTLNEMVKRMSDEEILGFTPFRSLEYYVKNVDIVITINQLKKFLNFFGYKYDSTKFPKLKVANKTRGVFSKETCNRLEKVFEKDLQLYRQVLGWNNKKN